MQRLNRSWIWNALVISLLGALVALGAQVLQARPAAPPAPAAQGIYRGLLTVERFDVSPPLSSIKPIVADPLTAQKREDDREVLPWYLPGQEFLADPHAQTALGPRLMPTPIANFGGVGNILGVNPPDTNGEVGPNHYVQMVNSYFQIFNKSGGSVYGPAANNTLWSGFGGPCQDENAGDPVALYDQLADRWFLSQFTGAGPTYYFCVAVSQSSNPAGAYYRYAINTGTNFPDYPKAGVWPDAYYVSTREFAGNTFAGIGAYAINRTQFLAGNPSPQLISFLAPPSPAYNTGDGLLPADLDGSAGPPSGSPNYWVGTMDDGGPYGAPQDALTFWKYHVDWTTPSNSSFTLANTISMGSPFDTIFSLCTGRSCIPQPGTSFRADIQSYRQRALHRLAYRNFGDHEALVTNQSVEGTTAMAGIRWWELRNLSTTPTIYQQGTYVPGSTDSIHRWMGSIALDRDGNMALGYSVSDASSVYPGIRYTGRLASDTLGQMPQGEATLIDGGASMTSGGNRWGDYSAMSVDPTDDCTFWYTTEYYAAGATGSQWSTRIGSFKFPTCGGGATATPTSAVPTNTPTNTPIPVSPTPTQTPATPCQPGASDYQVSASTGTIVAASTDSGSFCDDCITTIALPFSFGLYGQSYSSVWADSNGTLQFSGASSQFTNSCLPAGVVNDTIAAYWDDLLTSGNTTECAGYPSQQCGIFTSTTGSAPNRTFYIEWRAHYFGGSIPAHFEVVLHEGSADFEVIYESVVAGTSTATLGVQQSNTGPYTEYACNGSGGTITTGTKLLYTAGASACTEIFLPVCLYNNP